MRDKLLILAGITTALMATLLVLTMTMIALGTQGVTSANTALLFIALYLTYRSTRYLIGRRRKVRNQRMSQSSASPIATTEAVFTQTAAAYDHARAKLIPCYAEFYAAAVALLPESTDHVLDLGAGTGLLSAFVRERFPDAYLHMMDNSAAMLDQARERFSRDQETVFQLADYTVAIENRRYDAVVSALSIHHLPNDAKRKLFARILPALKPGGVFVNAEQVLQPTPELEARAKEEWLSEVRALGATDEQVAASLLRQTEDRCATIANQLRWLAEAGFENPRCTFEQGRFAVLTASR